MTGIFDPDWKDNNGKSGKGFSRTFSGGVQLGTDNDSPGGNPALHFAITDQKRLRNAAIREIDDLIDRMMGYHKPYDDLLYDLLVDERMKTKLMIEELIHALQGTKGSS